MALSAEQERRMGRVVLFIGDFHCREFKRPGRSSNKEHREDA